MLKRKGMALILVLFITLILVLLSFTYIHVVILESGTSRLNYNSDAALQIAKAGINYAIFCMGQKPNWTTYNGPAINPPRIIPAKAQSLVTQTSVNLMAANGPLNPQTTLPSGFYPVDLGNNYKGEWRKIIITPVVNPLDGVPNGVAPVWHVLCEAAVTRYNKVIAVRQVEVILGERSTNFCILEKNVRSWNLNNAPPPNPTDGTDDCIGFTGYVNINGPLKIDGHLAPDPGTHDGNPNVSGSQKDKWGDLNLWKSDGTIANPGDADHPQFPSSVSINSSNTHASEVTSNWFPGGLRTGAPNVGLGNDPFVAIGGTSPISPQGHGDPESPQGDPEPTPTGGTPPAGVFQIKGLTPKADIKHPQYVATSTTNPAVVPLVKVYFDNNGTVAKYSIVYRYFDTTEETISPEATVDLSQYRAIFVKGGNVELTGNQTVDKPQGGQLGNTAAPRYLTIAAESDTTVSWTNLAQPTRDETPRMGNIFISGNLTYGNEKSILGILAENYVFLNGRNTVNKNLEVNAVLRSKKRSIQFDWFNDMRRVAGESFNNTGELDLRGIFTLKGAIISPWADVEGTVWKVGDKQGYCNQQISYDERLRYGAPPFMSRDPGNIDGGDGYLEFSVKRFLDNSSLK